MDDDDDSVFLTERALAKHEVPGRVVVAHDGDEALEMLFGPHSRLEPGDEPVPSLVLLDLSLPRLGGLQVLQRLRDDPRTTLIPIVVLSSSTRDDDRLASYRLGANSYLSKPVRPEEFSRAVGLCARYWLELNEPVPIDGRPESE